MSFETPQNIQEILKNRKYYAELQRLEIFVNNAGRIKENLINYGRDPEKKIKISEKIPSAIFLPGMNELYNPQ